MYIHIFERKRDNGGKKNGNMEYYHSYFRGTQHAVP